VKTDLFGTREHATPRNDHRRLCLEDLGAWLLKGNADRADLICRFVREPRVTRWCVQPSYRLGLMRAGHPVLFWASGSRQRTIPYGIWGCGRLAGSARTDPEGRWSVPLDLVIADPPEWLPRAILAADPRMAGLEVLRQPQAANPSFVTRAQFAVLAEHPMLRRLRRGSRRTLDGPPRP
jgi:hypothetical protein